MITAAQATSIALRLTSGTDYPLERALRHELEEGPTFVQLSDEDVAMLINRCEIELHARGWFPQRQWHKREAAAS